MNCIKNTSADKTYVGQFIASGGFYQLNTNEVILWTENALVLSDIASGDLVVSTTSNDSGLILNASTGLSYLKNNISSYDKSIQTLDDNKASKNLSIDLRTMSLISGGFAYAGYTFSLSQTAQNNWQGIKNDKDWQPYPFGVTTIDDQEYTFNDATDVFNFYVAGKTVIAGHYNSGRALKLQVNSAVDQAALDLIIDSR